MRYWFLGGWAAGLVGIGVLLAVFHGHDGPPAYGPLSWVAYGLAAVLAVVAIGVAVVEVGVRAADR